jgi:hypothetical protein
MAVVPGESFSRPAFEAVKPTSECVIVSIKTFAISRP